MKYQKIITGKFIERPNRFIAKVLVNNEIQTVHVKNTGRCKELLLPGSTVILQDFIEEAQKGLRKTAYDLIAVYKGNLLINVDSQAPNKVVNEWLENQNLMVIHPEYTYGNSRVDFYLEKKEAGECKKILMEVKGCTLEIEGTGYFPDAPTERGVKHLNELAKAVDEGFECYLAFVIQIPGVKIVYPNVQTHPEFGAALENARQKGVQILYLECEVKENELKIISPPNFL